MGIFQSLIFRYLVFLSFLLLFFQRCSIFNFSDTGKTKVISERESFMFTFYNVENLFDTINNPLTNDEDFLPEGNYRWSSYRYYDKLQKIAKVIIAVGGWKAPDIVGLCELENRLVLDELLSKTPLKSFNYEIIHKESPDFRGIDVALLYRKKFFRPLFYDFYVINNPEDTAFKTREILYAKGLVNNKDTVHVFVNHWPSRRGGTTQSESNRVLAATVLKSKTDSILNINPLAYIVIVGDFNDEPSDKSITEILQANGDSLNVNNTRLFNLLAYSEKEGKGSYKYKHEWNQIDQIIVSNAFFEKNASLYFYYNSGKVFKEDFLLIDDDKYPDKKPWRTYNGPTYNGGFSDHLPVYLEVFFR